MPINILIRKYPANQVQEKKPYNTLRHDTGREVCLELSQILRKIYRELRGRTRRSKAATLGLRILYR